MYPSSGLVLTADPTRQPPGTTRLHRNARPRDWADGGTLRGAQRPGQAKFSTDQLSTTAIQSMATASPSLGGTTITSAATWSDGFTRNSSSGTLGDFTGDASDDYQITAGTAKVAIGATMTTAGSPASGSYAAFSWLAAYAAGDAARSRVAGYLEDNVQVGTNGGPNGQLSAAYFKPTSGGTLPTDNFYIKFTVTVADCTSTNTESAVGFFVNGAGATVNGGAVDNAFYVLLTKTRVTTTGYLKVVSGVNNTTDDDCIPVTGWSIATARPAATITNSLLCDPSVPWANGSKKTIELRKNGNRVEIRIGDGYVASSETEAYCTFENITQRSDTGGATAVVTSQTDFGVILFNVASAGSPAFSKIENLEVGTCSLNSATNAPTRVVVVAGGDVLSGDEDGFDTVTSGSDVYSADDMVEVFAGLGRSTTSGIQYVYVLDGSTYKKVSVGGSSASLTTWAGTTGGGSLPAGSTDATTKATHGLVWRNRIVLYGVRVNPDNWYMSRAGDPEDWLYTSTTDPVRRAVAGNESDTGLFSYAISCMSPLDSDRLIVASTNQLWAMVGDPMLGGQFAVVTDRVGIVGPYATARDPYGNFYFCALDGIYVIKAGTLTPVPLSKDRIDPFFRTLDFSTLRVQLAWSRAQDGLFAFLSPTDGTAGVHLFWDRMNDSWGEDTYPADAGPAAICIYNDDNPLDDAGGDMILMGGNDGYVRRFDPRAFDDDGEQIDSQVDLPPLQADGICRVSLERLDPVWGSTSDRVSMEIRRSRAVGTLDSADAAMRRTFMATGPSAPWTARSTAGAIGIRLKSAGSGRHWSMANLSAMVGMSEDMVVRTA